MAKEKVHEISVTDTTVSMSYQLWDLHTLHTTPYGWVAEMTSHKTGERIFRVANPFKGYTKLDLPTMDDALDRLSQYRRIFIYGAQSEGLKVD